MKGILLLFFSLFITANLFSQFNCANAVPLTPGIQQCGDSSGQLGDFDAAGITTLNPCDLQYNDDEYWYKIETESEGFLLELELSNIVSTWTGLFLFNNCPGDDPFFCVASDINTGSISNLSIEVILDPFTEYKIAIINWGPPDNTAFCIDATTSTPPAAPLNDECSGAFPLTVNADLECGSSTSGTLYAATPSPEDDTSCSGTENDDVWFSFTATATSHTIELLNIANGTMDLYHSVWEGSCGSLSLVPGTCSDPETSEVTGLTIGNSYFIRVNSYTMVPSQSSTFDVCIGTIPAPPINDICEEAITLTNGVPLSGITTWATNVENLTPCQGGGGDGICDSGGTGTTDFSEGVWFVYTSVFAGESIKVDTDNAGTNFDTQVIVYEGSCGSLTCVGGDDDGGDGSGQLNDSEFCWAAAAAGVDYYIYLTGFDGAKGNYTVLLEVLPPINNNCDNAIPIANGDYITGQTLTATNEEAFISCSFGGGGGLCDTGGSGITDFSEGVWFVYTSTAPGESIKVDTDNAGTDFDTEIIIYLGSCGSLTCIGGDDDGGDGTGNNGDSEMCWITTGTGLDYFIYIDGHDGAKGNFNVHLEVLKPDNDECVEASVLATNTAGSLINQFFAGATNSGLPAEVCDSGATPTPRDVWYSINTDADGGNLIVTVEPGPNSDIVVAIYNACGAPIPEQCVDLGGDGSPETINFLANISKGKGTESSTRDSDYFVRVYEKVATGEPFEIGAQGAALPIVLGNFDAKAEKRGNNVTWTTLSEINSNYIEVQGSPNGSTNWEVVGTVEAKGQSSLEVDYEIFDANPYEVTYYRLNAVDQDGTKEYSKIINVRRNDVLGKMTVFPNPALNTITAQTGANGAELASYSILDATGRIVLSGRKNLIKGLNSIELSLESLSPGIYMFRLLTEDRIQIKKFVKE